MVVGSIGAISATATVVARAPLAPGRIKSSHSFVLELYCASLIVLAPGFTTAMVWPLEVSAIAIILPLVAVPLKFDPRCVHVESSGMGASNIVGNGVGLGVGLGVGCGVGLGVGLGVGCGVGLGVGCGVGSGVGGNVVGVRVGAPSNMGLAVVGHCVGGNVGWTGATEGSLVAQAAHVIHVSLHMPPAAAQVDGEHTLAVH